MAKAYRRISPCLDVKDGRLVKGINFVDLKDIGDPAQNAAVYSEAGADELVFLDITATVEDRKTLIGAVKRTVDSITVPLTVGSSKAVPSGFEVMVNGGTKPTGIDAVEWARDVEASGAGAILPTSMDADGTQAGYDIPMTKAIADAVNLPVIASGGAGTLEHLYEAIAVGHADAVLVATTAHYGTYSVQQMKEYLAEKGIPVRL